MTETHDPGTAGCSDRLEMRPQWGPSTEIQLRIHREADMLRTLFQSEFTMTGKTLGHYKIVSQIGSGGMGAVYLAQDQKLQREVALKVLPPELASNLERLERFQREARAVAALNHPNIVTLFSVEVDDGTHFITMELVKGQPLNKVIPDSGQSVKDFLDTAVQLADALATAHEKGITHRDLKPANVMINDAGRVKVIDFGLAKAAQTEASSPDLSQVPTEQLTMEGRIIGTPSYMAPEQVEGKGVDHRTDIFSLGILFHEMLIGERPFKGESNMSIMSAILKDDPSTISDLRPEIPFEISRIIRRCLQKNPTERFQSALDIRNELKELQNEFLTGTLTSLQNPQVPSAEKNKVVNWTLGIVGVNLVIAVIAFFAWPGGDGESGEGRSAGSVSPIDTSGAPNGFPAISRVTTNNRLEEMPTWSPDGRRIAFVAPSGDHKHIFIRDLDSGDVSQLTSGNYDFVHPAWGPDTNTMYFARSIREGGTIGRGDAKVGFWVDSVAAIYRHNLVTGEAIQIVARAVEPAVAPGGTNLFYVSNDRIFRSDLLGNRAQQLTSDEDGMSHGDISVSSDGQKVAFRRGSVREDIHELQVVNLKGEITTARAGRNYHPTWHPSGAYIYFTTYRGAGQNIWRIPLNADNTPAGDAEPVTVGGGEDAEAAFSPDGKRMLFTISSVNADIYRVSIDPVTGQTNGPPAEPMPFNSNSEDSRAAWAPTTNENMIAFNSDRYGDMNLFIWREADNSVTQVTTGGPGGDYQATWSGDLKQLAFFSSRAGNADIWVVGTNANSTPIQLTTHPGLDYNPFFSPDGKQIVFASDRTDTGLELHIMNADGSDQRLLTRDASIAHFHPWYDDESVFNALSRDGVIAYYRIFPASGQEEKFLTIDPKINDFGGHTSFSPDKTRIMELNWPHTHIMVMELGKQNGGAIYHYPHPDAKLDYPWWSPDGKWATFDMSLPRSSEIYLAEWTAN